ncbi:MAG: lipopolysaccharide heptosyltransferase I [Syntrophobacteraceae bacterium]
MKILIVKASALGDIVHALPVLPYLKSASPNLEIDWVVEEPFASLLSANPMVHRLHILRTKAWRKARFSAQARRELFELLGSLRRERYDVVLDLQGNVKSGMLTLAAHAPLRYGFDRSGAREWPNLLATNRKVALSEADYHIMDRTMLAPMAAFPGGKRSDAPGPLFVAPKIREEMARDLEERGLSGKKTTVFHCGASWQTKRWENASWAELARKVEELLGLNVILTWGGETEHADCRVIWETSGKTATIWPRVGIPQMAALLESASVVVGGDTGLIHMAAALGTPTVSFYTATHSLRNGPRGEKHRLVQSNLPCSPCLRRDCRRLAECRASIRVGDMLEAIAAAIA